MYICSFYSMYIYLYIHVVIFIYMYVYIYIYISCYKTAIRLLNLPYDCCYKIDGCPGVMPYDDSVAPVLTIIASIPLHKSEALLCVPRIVFNSIYCRIRMAHGR